MTTEVEALECLDGPDGCEGAVEWRWPGYGERNWPRCEKHAEARIEREQETQRRYGSIAPPSDWSPLDAGEAWDEDGY